MRNTICIVKVEVLSIMNAKQELLELLNQIIIHFEVQAQYGGVEKDIADYYSKVRDKCYNFDFKEISIYNWSRPYLEANSDWENPILITMEKANELIQYFQKSV